MQGRFLHIKVYYKRLYSVWKETSHKSLKVAAAKKSVPSVYVIDATCFYESILFHVIIARHTNYTIIIQIYRYSKVWCNHQVAAFFETSVLK